VSTLADPVALGPPDFVRDQWQRPLIVPPDGGRPRPYMRASAAAKTVEDTYNLELWARRNVAFGMARDHSLVARVLALGGDPSTWDLDTKKACNEIVEDAAGVALAHRAADVGTALHRMTELVDRGQAVDAGPWQGDLEAYVNTLIEARLTVVEVECRLVCDELEMAGTADRIVRDAAGRHRVADIKTGETVDYGGLGWAAQLAAYAHSVFYDSGTGARSAPPVLDATTGLIVHLPAGQGRCVLYEIDLVAGYRAAQLANEIRSVRRQARRWITELTPGEEEAPVPSLGPPVGDGAGARRQALRDRYNRLDGHRQGAFRARAIDPDDLDAIEAALDALEPHPVDPEVLAASTEVAAINSALLTLTADQKLRLDAIARDAINGPGSISFRFEPFARNVHVCRALLACCQAGLDDAAVRDLVSAVAGDEVQPAVTLGAALGALTLAEAARLDEMASAAIP